MNKAPAKKVTLKSLADALGLSFSTISKSLNGNPNINAETRALVEAKAREMGYAPNLFAQSLRTKSSKSIAVIFNDDAAGVGIANVQNQIHRNCRRAEGGGDDFNLRHR